MGSASAKIKEKKLIILNKVNFKNVEKEINFSLHIKKSLISTKEYKNFFSNNNFRVEYAKEKDALYFKIVPNEDSVILNKNGYVFSFKFPHNFVSGFNLSQDAEMFLENNVLLVKINRL